jgi:hypothetical protein
LWGGQIGANYQFARHWVVGAEIDGAFARFEDSRIRPDPLFPLTLLADTVKLNSLTTVRGRLGFRLGPHAALCHRAAGRGARSK